MGQHSKPQGAKDALETMCAALDRSGQGESSEEISDVTAESHWTFGASQVAGTYVRVDGTWYRVAVAAVSAEEQEILEAVSSGTPL